MAKKVDAQTLVGTLLQDAAESLGTAVQHVRFKQFKDYALPIIEERGLDDALAFIRHWRGAVQFNRFRDVVADWTVEPDAVAEEDLGIIGRQSRKVYRDRARELAGRADFLETFSTLLEDNKFKLPDYRPPANKGTTNRIVNLLLSDLHYGADLKPQQNLLQYNWTEEARRTASIFAQTCAYKRDHRAESILHIYLNGDIIQGMLGHDPRDGHPVTKQFFGAYSVLVQGILFAATQFKAVKVFCQPGNHGRIKDRHFGRATIDKWDAYETMLYGAIQAAFVKAPNVQFFQDETPWGEYEAFGRRGMYTHGDTVVPAGNPSKTLNMHAIESFIERTNSARAAEGKPVFELVMIGHTHFPVATLLDSGTWFINNGCLIPPDGFSASIGRIHKKHNVQLLWESTEDHIVGDLRFLKVGRYSDADGSLDPLVKPYDGKLVLPKF
jgi:predicted phosphodiesterase